MASFARFAKERLELCLEKHCPELSWAELEHIQANQDPEFRRAAEEAKERCRARREAERRLQAATKAWTNGVDWSEVG